MDLELHVYRKQNNETRLMQDQIVHLESEALQLRQKIEALRLLKDHFEKEYHI